MKRVQPQGNKDATDQPSGPVKKRRYANKKDSFESQDSWYGGVDPYAIDENSRESNKYLKRDFPNIDPYTLPGQFKIHMKIGSGAQGRVFLGSKDNEMKFAIKVSVEKHYRNTSPISEEFDILSKLQKNENFSIGIPQAIQMVKHCNYHMLVMTRFGSSIEKVVSRITHSVMRAKYAANVGLRILSTLKCIHEQGVIHGDVKPDHMVLGIDRSQPLVYLIDFGLASRFLSSDGVWLPQEGGMCQGTAQYASLRTHYGYRRGPADDLISLGYSIIEIINDRLPWSTLENSTWSTVEICKKHIDVRRLCKGAASPMIDFFLELWSVEWGNFPDYEKLERCLNRILQ